MKLMKALKWLLKKLENMNVLASIKGCLPALPNPQFYILSDRKHLVVSRNKLAPAGPA